MRDDMLSCCVIYDPPSCKRRHLMPRISSSDASSFSLTSSQFFLCPRCVMERSLAKAEVSKYSTNIWICLSIDIHSFWDVLYSINYSAGRLEAMLPRILESLYTGQFGGVHAFRYNSAVSEPISMKSGALWTHCWGGGRPWQIFGAICAVATVWEAGEIFCAVNSARFHRFPVGQILRHLNTI